MERAEATAIEAVLGAVQERWGIHSLTRGYNGALASGLSASQAAQVARAAPVPTLPPWWPGAVGYLRPSLLELSGPPSCGKLGLSLLWLAAASRGGLLAVMDLDRTFYPPAAAASGLDLDRLVVVHPPDRRGTAEAVSLLLSSGGFDAILWPVEWKTRPSNLDSVRLSTLAARSSTTLLALVTDRRRAVYASSSGAGSRLFPSADVRLRVTGWEWTWRDGELAGVRPRVRTERLRGAPSGQEWELRLERPADDLDTTVAHDATADRGDPSENGLRLAAAFPLRGGGVGAAGSAGPADRGVRPDAAPAPAARSA
ncbi:MAG: hypothetical protein U0893_26860 [Chloroflexota bacterium]